MRLIAHRGNISSESCENNPQGIERRISDGFDVEIDLWNVGSSWFLGHDYPAYEISRQQLITYRESLWIHCKNTAALVAMSILDDHTGSFNYFWHEDDFYTVTSAGFIWAHPRVGLITNTSNTVLVLPDSGAVRNALGKGDEIFGICSDEPDLFL